MMGKNHQEYYKVFGEDGQELMPAIANTESGRICDVSNLYVNDSGEAFFIQDYDNQCNIWRCPGKGSPGSGYPGIVKSFSRAYPDPRIPESALR